MSGNGAESGLAKRMAAIMIGGMIAWLSVDCGRAGAEVKAPETELQKIVLETPRADRLKAWHTLLASEPHIAGTEGDAREIERIRKAFTEMGLEVEVHEILVYLPMPIDAKLEILEPMQAKSSAEEGPPNGQNNVEGKFAEDHSPSHANAEHDDQP
ncbi:MAG TPA: hypothetical protein VG711_00445, partial [Phycisphaerales bacterium]|nr:hypothetical protein [Phycisphaerales bacterium]